MTMSDTEILICLIVIFIPVILMSFWYVFTISKEIDMDIERCELLKRWAKRNIDEREGDHHED